MDRAKCILSTTTLRQNEKRRVISDLKANGYPEGQLVNRTEQTRNQDPRRIQRHTRPFHM